MGTQNDAIPLCEHIVKQPCIMCYLFSEVHKSIRIAPVESVLCHR